MPARQGRQLRQAGLGVRRPPRLGRRERHIAEQGTRPDRGSSDRPSCRKLSRLGQGRGMDPGQRRRRQGLSGVAVAHLGHDGRQRMAGGRRPLRLIEFVVGAAVTRRCGLHSGCNRPARGHDRKRRRWALLGSCRGGLVEFGLLRRMRRAHRRHAREGWPLLERRRGAFGGHNLSRSRRACLGLRTRNRRRHRLGARARNRWRRRFGSGTGNRRRDRLGTRARKRRGGHLGARARNRRCLEARAGLRQLGARAGSSGRQGIRP